MNDLERRLDAAINKVAKWRSIFASWQLGTRSNTDPECKAVKDHREATILLRAETSALVALLIEKGAFTLGEFQEQLVEEAAALDKLYEEKFPGMESTEHGMALNLAVIQEHGTMEGWRA